MSLEGVVRYLSLLSFWPQPRWSSPCAGCPCGFLGFLARAVASARFHCLVDGLVKPGVVDGVCPRLIAHAVIIAFFLHLTLPPVSRRRWCLAANGFSRTVFGVLRQPARLRDLPPSQ